MQQAGTEVSITFSVVSTQQITMFKFYAMKILLKEIVSFVRKCITFKDDVSSSVVASTKYFVFKVCFTLW